MLHLILIVLLVTIVRFAVGGLWYMSKSPLGKAWFKSQSSSVEHMNKAMGKKAMTYGFVFTFISTFILSLMLTPLGQMNGVLTVSILVPALILAGLIWIGFIVPVLAQRKIYNVHDNYSWVTFFIDAGYELISIAVGASVFVLFM